MSGPFETEGEVIDAIGLLRWQPRDYDAANALMLHAACLAAGVELGAYVRRILAWLAAGEPQTCAVIAGLIERAAS